VPLYVIQAVPVQYSILLLLLLISAEPSIVESETAWLAAPVSVKTAYGDASLTVGFEMPITRSSSNPVVFDAGVVGLVGFAFG